MYTQAELSSFDEKEYRDAYVDGTVKGSIAHQIRSLREKLGLSQSAFAKLVGKPQSVISRLEDTEYGRVTAQTLLDLAHALDVALIIRFSSFPDFLIAYDDVSPAALAVDNFGHTQCAVTTDVGSPGIAGPVSAPANPASVSIVVGQPYYFPTTRVASETTVCVTGLAISPFVLMQTATQGGITNG